MDGWMNCEHIDKGRNQRMMGRWMDGLIYR